MIKVYSQQSCLPCRNLKSFLQLQGIPYEPRMIDEDEDAKQELEALGFSSTPVTVFEDGEALVGFTPPTVSRIMEKMGR